MNRKYSVLHWNKKKSWFQSLEDDSVFILGLNLSMVRSTDSSFLLLLPSVPIDLFTREIYYHISVINFAKPVNASDDGSTRFVNYINIP